MAFMVEMGDVRRLAGDVDPGLLEAEVRYAYVFVPYREGDEGRVESSLQLLMDSEVAFGFEEPRLTVELVAGAVLEFAGWPGEIRPRAVAVLTDGRIVKIMYRDGKLEFITVRSGV